MSGETHRRGLDGDLRVLVVDDDFMVASIHARFVEQAPGFAVVGRAASGTEALDLVERLRPDLVLLDVHLPDLSGIEVLRRLRGRGDDVGVIVVTAAREVDTVRAAAAAGAAHYLVKPFEHADLVARLQAFRATQDALRGVETPDQRHIDAVFSPLGRTRAQLPKGLSVETAGAVLEALARAGELSAGETAEEVGISRVSCRRYLEHFVEQGTAVVGLRYGGAGRPERRYRLAPSSRR